MRAAFHSSRPAVLRHAKPVAMTFSSPRLVSLAAALVVTFSSSLQPALAGNFLQEAVERKAAEIQANVQKASRSRLEPPVLQFTYCTARAQTDFQERYAKFQEDSSNAAEATKSAVEATKDGSALDGLALNIDLSGSRPLDLSGVNSLGGDALGEAKRRIAKFQSAAELEKNRALKLNAADVAVKQERAAEVAAQVAAYPAPRAG